MPDRDDKPKVMASCTIQTKEAAITFVLKEFKHEEDDCDASGDFRYVVESLRIGNNGGSDSVTILKTNNSVLAIQWFVARTT